MHRLIPVLLLVTSFQCYSQRNQDFDKLIISYADGKPEQCIKIGKKLAKKKYKEHPTPYYYISLAYFDIYLDRQFDEKYPDAMTKSVEFAVLFSEKKGANNYDESETESLQHLSISIWEEIDLRAYNEECSEEELNISIGLTKIFPNALENWFLKAQLELLSGDKGDYESSVHRIMSLLKEMDSEQLQLHIKNELFIHSAIQFIQFAKEKGEEKDASFVYYRLKALFNDDDAFYDQFPKWD